MWLKLKKGGSRQIFILTLATKVISLSLGWCKGGKSKIITQLRICGIQDLQAGERVTILRLTGFFDG